MCMPYLVIVLTRLYKKPAFVLSLLMVNFPILFSVGIPDPTETTNEGSNLSSGAKC